MSFNGTEGAPISLAAAAALTKNYRASRTGTTHAHFFGKDVILQLLDIPEAVGIREYYGLTEAGEQELVLVAVDAQENDLEILTIDCAIKCPPKCGISSSLNS
jgi:hypothetical protein